MNKLYKIIVNNYILGAKIKSTPIHKIEIKNRLNESHTEIIYKNLTITERDLIKKVTTKNPEFIGFIK